MLSDGRITVEGPFLDSADSMLAVTGGTGKYAGVRGEMLLHARNAGGTAYDFKYSLMYYVRRARADRAARSAA